MTLTPGTRLGPYEIQSALGAGGMGEVYRASDTNLGRQVAIKVLPDAFAQDAERLARFEREAKTLASLNHPNIAQIYGLEKSSGVQALVMELVEGEDLSQRIARGPIPLDEALPIARQIAEALEAAHDQGIIHRDLKPANIKVRPDGAVKVLDFGLAKLVESDARPTSLTMSPTLSVQATYAGVILGTAAYMSPEQARGRPVDRRSDIWAFGCVFYEMLTGRHAFMGETVTDVLAAIVNSEPAWTGLPAGLSPSVRVFLARCLHKDPKQRVGDIRDVRLALEGAFEHARHESLGGRHVSRRGWIGAALLVAAFASLTAIWAVTRSSPPQSPSVTRFGMTLPPGDRLADGGVAGGAQVALSPDGRYIAYVAVRGGVQQIFLRAMNSSDAQSVPGTEGAGGPFFSPDGKWLGFVAATAVYKVPISGGETQRLTALASGGSRGWIRGTWSDRGTIALAPGLGPIAQVPADGGPLKALAMLASGETDQLWPEFLPGGNGILFSGRFGNARALTAYSITNNERRDLHLTGTSPRYARSGHLLYVQNGTLMAVSFDANGLEVTGPALAVAENVLQNADGTAYYDVSSTGTLAYVSGAVAEPQRRLVWVQRNGTMQELPAPLRQYDWPQLSPDGQRVAVEIGPQIWIYDLVRDNLTRFTLEGNLNQAPVWTPDGKRIVFNSAIDGSRSLFWQPADGSGAMEQLSSSDSVQVAKSWSADGRLLAFHQGNPATIRDIWVWRASDRKAEPFLRTRFTEGAPSFSPDGRWLAYVSDESGGPQIYVQPYPGPGGKWQISTDGGTEPTWNRNGRELFYRAEDRMMAVDVSSLNGFVAGKPHTLFEGQYVRNPFPLTGIAYDVSSDGQRFLMVREAGQARAEPQLNVTVNWFEELKRLVPTK